MSFLKKVYNKCRLKYIKIRSKKTMVSLGDVFHERYETDINQFLVASRYLDVKMYTENGERDFYYQNTISRAAYGKRHLEEKGNNTFMSLIESFKKSGYDASSLLTVDKNLRIFDGTHRFALCLYYNIDSINVRVFKGESKSQNNIDWYYSKKLESNFICEILESCNKIREKLIEKGDCFGCVIDRYDENMISDFKNLTVLNKIDKIPHIDGSYYLRFILKNPEYAFEGGKMNSFRIKALSDIMKVRYPDIKMQFSNNCLEGLKLYKKYFG